MGPQGPATGLQAEKNAAPLLPSTGGGVGVMSGREGAHPWPSQTRRDPLLKALGGDSLKLPRWFLQVQGEPHGRQLPPRSPSRSGWL